MSELKGLELMPEAMKIRKIREQELEIASLRGRIIEAIGEFGELHATATRLRGLLRRSHVELLRLREAMDYDPFELSMFIEELDKELKDDND